MNKEFWNILLEIVQNIFGIIFGKIYEKLKEKYEIFKKNVIMYKGNYAVIFGENYGGILKRFWKFLIGGEIIYERF